MRVASCELNLKTASCELIAHLFLNSGVRLEGIMCRQLLSEQFVCVVAGFEAVDLDSKWIVPGVIGLDFGCVLLSMLGGPC